MLRIFGTHLALCHFSAFSTRQPAGGIRFWFAAVRSWFVTPPHLPEPDSPKEGTLTASAGGVMRRKDVGNERYETGRPREEADAGTGSTTQS
jgi:hypothetical protein